MMAWRVFMIWVRLFGAAVLFTIAGIRGFFRMLGWGFRTTKVVKGHIKRELKCPVGHTMAADGGWECGSCGAKRLGFAWSTCPACKLAPAHVPCAECGLAIVNPAV
jgi:hypothetical protein